MSGSRDDLPSSRAISTREAPAPVAHYSQALCAGGFVFVAGQGPVDPRTGSVVSDHLRPQVERTLENVTCILRAADCDVEHVVSVRVFLTSVDDFTEFNLVYEEYFRHVSTPPARTTVYVGLPAGMRVEIDVVAFAGAP